MNQQFNIGDYVKVTGITTFGWNEGKRRTYTEECKPFMAQITGGSYKYTGKIATEYNDPGFGVYDGNYFVRDKTVFLFIVKRGFTNRDIYVLPIHIISLSKEEQRYEQLPLRYFKNKKEKMNED